MDAATDQPVPGFDPMPANAVIVLRNIAATTFNILANTEPWIVGSVRFGFDGNASYNTESNFPYTMVLSSVSATQFDYAGITLATGAHTVTATPYSAAGAGGTAGTPLTLNFTVVDSLTKGIMPAGRNFSGPRLIGISPNPFRNHLLIRYVLPQAPVQEVRCVFFNALGRIVWQTSLNRGLNPGFHTLRVGGTSFVAPGVYTLQMTVREKDRKEVTAFSRRIINLP